MMMKDKNSNNSPDDLEGRFFSHNDLYMYSHEGQPLIRKLAPLIPSQMQQPSGRKPSASAAGCSLRMVIAGFLFLVLFCALSPPSRSGKNSNTTDNNYTQPQQQRQYFRPFQKSWQSLTSSAPQQNEKEQPPSSLSQQPQQRVGCRQIVPAKVTVRTDLVGFASYWNYASSDHPRPMHVAYDERSLLINGERTLFLSGSMHPVRATRDSWNLACDEAVRNGLNMITIYVFWSAHQRRPDQPNLDWSLPGNTLDCQEKLATTATSSYLANTDESRETRTSESSIDGEHDGSSFVSTQSSSLKASKSTLGGSVDDNIDDDCPCRWDLATAIRAAASRGLWIHIRLGPYDCAEYNYGGIPEWLPLQKPDMRMRRYDPDWLQAMQGFVTSATQYLKEEQLWAYQGGPIVMAQIENELGGDDDDDNEQSQGVFMSEDAAQKHNNNTRMQDYAQWCGDLATRLEPDVVWTMCNGLSANQTIATCNGAMGGHSCSTTWLEQYGDSGRIQKTQPAIWTEAEQGFQVWGETPNHPSDYFWGTTSRAMAYDALRWFARGGASLNWYMWWGGYNRGRAAAAGITNMYASDAPLCPSGQRRQPKFGHVQALHESLADVAALLLQSPSELFSSRPIEFMNPQGRWEVGQSQRVFVYRQQNEKHRASDSATWREAHFVENDASYSTVVRFPIQTLGIVKVLAMEPQSSALVVDGMLRFDSAAVNPRSMSYSRVLEKNSVMMVDWQQWMEPRTAESWQNRNNHSQPRLIRSTRPMEQTNLTTSTHVDSDYVWYETNLTLQGGLRNSTVLIETQKASAFAVFVDGELVGAANNHQHAEGYMTLAVPLGDLQAGLHSLAILSESLGYFNLIGRWGASTRPKKKGITGSVVITGTIGENVEQYRQNLVDGRDWLSFAGLHGESSDDSWERRDVTVERTNLDAALERGGNLGAACTWSSALFDTPNYDPVSQALFVEITVGRGHLWLNGRDLGRFWNITRDGLLTSTMTTPKHLLYSQQYYLLPYDFLYTDGKLNELIFFNALDGDLRSAATLVMSWTQESDKPNFMDQVDFPLACV